MFMRNKPSYKKKKCKECNQLSYLFSKGRCKSCASKSYKKMNKVKKKTGERELFIEIWNERYHICTNCGINLGNEPKVGFFSHIKPKSIYPELRLDKNNIQLLCLTCHTAYDHGSKEKYQQLNKSFLNNQENN